MSRVAAFGEVMMRLETPGYGLLVQEDQLRYSFSGSGVNLLAAMARYGHEARLISSLPANSLGDAALGHLRRLGLSTSHMQRSGRFIGMYFLEKGFGARASRVTYTDRQGSSFNTASYTDSELEEAIKGIELLHFCGITLAMNDLVRDTMFRLADIAKRAGCLIAFDCNYRPSLWGDKSYEFAKPYYERMLGLADIVLMNEKDAIHILGMKTNATERSQQLQELIPLVAKQYDIRTIAGTHRSINGNNTHSLKGFIYRNEQLVLDKEYSFSVHDRVGAGDAFASGILDGLLRNMSLANTVAFAGAASRLAHTISGDTPLSSLEDICKAIDNETGDVER